MLELIVISIFLFTLISCIIHIYLRNWWVCKVIGRSVCLFCKSFCSSFFSPPSCCTLLGLVRTSQTVEWDRVFFLSPLCSLVLCRWCHCGWVIGSCPSLAGELAVYLRKCTWDKRRWQECGRPAEWREGRQLATALSELFYLSSWSPRAIVQAM